MRSLLALGLTSLSCAATIGAVWCWYRVRKLLDVASRGSLGRLQIDVSELRSLYESLLSSHRKIHARIGMREVRDRRVAEETEAAASAPVDKATDRETLRELARKRGLMR